MVLQLIGGRNSIVGPGRLENAGLFELMCSRNVGLGLGRFHNACGYQPFWKPIEAKRTAPVVYLACFAAKPGPQHWKGVKHLINYTTDATKFYGTRFKTFLVQTLNF
jgi:hypothetical protein